MTPPKASDIQIRRTPSGRWSVRCRHGWEQTSDEWFALTLWSAAWSPAETRVR